MQTIEFLARWTTAWDLLIERETSNPFLKKEPIESVYDCCKDRSIPHGFLVMLAACMTLHYIILGVLFDLTGKWCSIMATWDRDVLFYWSGVFVNLCQTVVIRLPYRGGNQKTCPESSLNLLPLQQLDSTLTTYILWRMQTTIALSIHLPYTSSFPSPLISPFSNLLLFQQNN